MPLERMQLRTFTSKKKVGSGLADGSRFSPGIDAFIEGLVQDYVAARTPAVAHPQLSRGVARSVSGVTEERLGLMIADAFPVIDHIYIDQELFVMDLPIKKPDLTMVIGTEIRLMVDVKMDLGYKRDELPGMAADAARMVDALIAQAATVTVNARVGGGRVPTQLTVAPHCEYVFVIVSGNNIGAWKLDNALWGWVGPWPKQLRVGRLVLWPTVHPNDPAFATPADATNELRLKLCNEAMGLLEAACVRTLA